MSARLSRWIEPPIRVGIYGCSFLLRSPLSWPCMLLGPLLSPLAVAMRRSLPAMARALGYHSVGIYGCSFLLRSPLSWPCMLLGPLLSPLAVAMRRSLPAMARALGYHSVG